MSNFEGGLLAAVLIVCAGVMVVATLTAYFQR